MTGTTVTRGGGYNYNTAKYSLCLATATAPTATCIDLHEATMAFGNNYRAASVSAQRLCESPIHVVWGALSGK